MAQIAANSVRLLAGGNIRKQGDETPLVFQLADEKGETVDLQGASVLVKIANQKAVFLEKTATINTDNTITFSLSREEATGHGDMRMEFVVTYSDSIMEIFPANGWQTIKITPSFNNAEVGGIPYVSVETMQADINSFKQEVNTDVEQISTTANTAKESADSTRTELDAVVNRETDSDAMSRQAAVNADGVDKVNLKARLDDDYGNVTSQLAEIQSKYTVIPEFFGASPDATASKNKEAIQQALDIGGHVRIGTAGTFWVDDTLMIDDYTKFELSPDTEIKIADGTNKNILRNKAVNDITIRNRNIEVVGGKWNMPTNMGNGINLHCIVFRRVDGFHVHDLLVDTKAGKYAINIGDCTDFEIDHIYFDDTNSDGVHINGPATNGKVHHIRGKTHDDSVAITANDYTAYADVFGDVTDVKIFDINTHAGAANNVKVLAGQDCLVDDIEVEKVRGTHAQFGVWLGDDNGQPKTDNGTHGTITVRDVDTTGQQTTSANVFANLANGAKKIVLDKVTLSTGQATNAIRLGFDSVIEQLQVSDSSIRRLSVRRLVRVEGTGSINQLTITRPDMEIVGGNGILLDCPSIPINNVNINDVRLITDDTSNTNWISLGDVAPVKSMVISGGYVDGGRCLIDTDVNATFTLTGGLVINNINRISNIYLSNPTFILGLLKVNQATNRLVMVNSTATGLTVLGGDGTQLPDSPTLFQTSDSQPVRVDGARIKADMASVTGQVGDMLTNDTWKGDIEPGHPVISDGAGTWKSLINGSTWLDTTP